MAMVRQCMCALVSTRRVHRMMHPLQGSARPPTSSSVGVRSSGPVDVPRLCLSTGRVANGESVQGSDIVDSAAATMQWKRSHYRKIEDKFSPLNQGEDDEDENDAAESADEKAKPLTQQLEPLTIESYEDVQPMWKEMESRVTRRRSLTLEQRGGVSGRRNVRKSDEDMWLEAGVYDDSSDKAKKK